MKARNDCEIACDCVKRANVVLHVRLCKQIFARKHTATHKPTSALSPPTCATMTHTHLLIACGAPWPTAKGAIIACGAPWPTALGAIMELYTCPCASHDISDWFTWLPHVSGGVIGNDHDKRSLQTRSSLVRSASEGKVRKQKVLFAQFDVCGRFSQVESTLLGRPLVSAIRISQVVAL